MPAKPFRPGFAALVALALAFGGGQTTAAARDGVPKTVAVEAHAIPAFKIRSDETHFGPFEYLGGLELSSPSRLFGGLSAMRLKPDGRDFIAVLDTGHWFTGRLEHDADGRLADVSDATVTAMRGSDSKVVQARYYYVDAEGLAIDGDRVLVSFEREHRIEVYPLDGISTAAPTGQLPHGIPLYEFRRNKGLETVAVAPPGTALDGAVVAISKKSINKKGDIFAAIVTGSGRGVFFVRRHRPYDVTDGDFLPNSDLLLLERRFSIAEGVGMRIRRIAGSDIRAGRTVDGEVLLETDFSFQIDNMESIDVYPGPDGETRIMLASDDNQSLLQRTLLLEFRMHDEAPSN